MQGAVCAGGMLCVCEAEREVIKFSAERSQLFHLSAQTSEAKF
jgi:hypothetical protein